MWQPLAKSAVVLSCCAVIGGVASSAAVPAKIPDSKSGKITSCVAKKGGAVRFINAQKGAKCKKSEKKVVFSQKGPAGPQGAPGPSDAYVADRDDTKSLNQMQVGPNTVLSLSLPSGAFVVTANASVIATTADTTVTCSFIAGAGTVASTSAATSNPQSLQSLAMTGTYTNTEAGTVGVLCQPSGPAFPDIGLGEARGATLVATKVDSVTGP